MFMDFREEPASQPWRPQPRPVRLTRKQEKRLGMVLLANVVLMFAAAPLAGSSVVAALLWMAA